MAALTPRRWILAAVAAVVGVAILGFAPNYLDVQRAADAARFRALVDEYGEFRFVVATVLDLVFAALYAATCFAFFGGRRGFAIGRWLVALGAIFDQIENLHVLRGVVDPEGLSDGAVEWMKRAGAAKSAALVLGVAALCFGGLRRRREDRADQSS